MNSNQFQRERNIKQRAPYSGPVVPLTMCPLAIKLSLFYVSARLSTNFAAHDMEMPNKTNTGSVGDIITISSDFHPVRALNWKGSI